ncbi:uncharacterized protein LOC126835703 [Adelges cooleyi]|uniref:uncharacterized protein LOC126835703 n=1 Tax=Adelges cooleyi TaxID=133065 RepID=UPI002180519F|nr:uncharacterized protein LOC126835703 [Adelges cooleyi]
MNYNLNVNIIKLWPGETNYKEHAEKTYNREWFMLYKNEVLGTNFTLNDILLYRSISPKVVMFIFKVAELCGVNDSVKYKCVELFDRFLNKYFLQKYYKVYKHYNKKWLKVLDSCQKQSCLYIMSCMQLVTKYSQQSTCLRKLKKIKNILNRCGHNYTIKSIICSEFNVFNTIDYKLNEPTIFLFVEYFIYFIDYENKTDLLSMCTMLTDFVYIHFNEIYDHLQYKKIGQRQYSYSEKMQFLFAEYGKISTAAAIIITATYFLDFNDEKIELITEYLSEECQMSPYDLRLISSATTNIIQIKMY